MVHLFCYLIRNADNQGPCHRLLVSAMVWAFNHRKWIGMRKWTRQTIATQAEVDQRALGQGIVCNGRFANCDLAGMDLHGLRLQDMDFSGSDCTGVDFSGSTLSRAVFNRTNLTGAKFVGASCAYGSFHNAILDGTDFTDANTMGASSLRVEHLFQRHA